MLKSICLTRISRHRVASHWVTSAIAIIARAWMNHYKRTLKTCEYSSKFRQIVIIINILYFNLYSTNSETIFIPDDELAPADADDELPPPCWNGLKGLKPPPWPKLFVLLFANALDWLCEFPPCIYGDIPGINGPNAARANLRWSANCNKSMKIIQYESIEFKCQHCCCCMTLARIWKWIDCNFLPIWKPNGILLLNLYIEAVQWNHTFAFCVWKIFLMNCFNSTYGNR